MKRRKFIKNAALALAAGSLGGPLWAEPRQEPNKLFRLTIFQTGNLNANLQATDGDKIAAGGPAGEFSDIAVRAAWFKKMRRGNHNSLLIDSGNNFFGSPFSHLYRGRLAGRVLNKCGYDVVAVGINDFADGVIALSQAIHRTAFDKVLSNYSLTDSPIAQVVKPFAVRQVADLQIGLLAVLPDITGLYPPEKLGGISYIDPRDILPKMISFLRHDAGCHFIILMSGLKDTTVGAPANSKLVEAVGGIDFLTGCAEGPAMKQPQLVSGPSGHLTRIFLNSMDRHSVGVHHFYFEQHLLKNSLSQPSEIK